MGLSNTDPKTTAAQRFIAKHNEGADAYGCIASSAKTLTVCVGWTRNGKPGFTTSTIPNTMSAARDWLQY